MHKKIALVTGASGFVGKKLTESLLAQGFKVIAISRRTSRASFPNNKNCIRVTANIKNFARLNSIFKKTSPNVVFHTAACIPRDNTKIRAEEYFMTNVVGTLNVLEASVQNKVKTVIFSSSMSVYGQDTREVAVDELVECSPSDVYGLSKLQAEKLCEWYTKKYKLTTVILRYAGIYGSGRKDGVVVNFIQRAQKDNALEIKKDIAWDIVSIADVITANVSAFQKATPGRSTVFNIGSGEGIHILKLAKLIIDLTHSNSLIIHKESGLPFSFFYDINKAKQLLDFSPVSLYRGLKQLIDST